MKRVVWTLLLVVFGVASVLLFTGPRMKIQPHIRAFQVPMPLLPPGVVTVEGAVGVPSAEEALALTNPLAATPATLARGRAAFETYCEFCHGRGGAGDGPVGQSYVPAPADLRAPGVQAKTDGQLLRAMLTGPGHERVLARVVPPDDRWPLVLQVRALGGR